MSAFHRTSGEFLCAFVGVFCSLLALYLFFFEEGGKLFSQEFRFALTLGVVVISGCMVIWWLHRYLTELGWWRSRG